jgi:hypothetical protein
MYIKSEITKEDQAEKKGDKMYGMQFNGFVFIQKGPDVIIDQRP